MSRLLLFAGLIAALLAPQGVAGASATAPEPGSARGTSETYRNPLDLRTKAGEAVETCADPAVIRGQQRGDRRWYLYCTTDPLSGDDRNADGDYNFRLIPTFTSRNLVHWTYRGDVFDERPEWMGDGGPWAPEPFYANGQYYLYYTAPNVPSGGSAIGVATSPTPLGPWTDKGSPVVEPHAPPGGEGLRWVF
ncbi:MAG: family 43 glycosylhydrolase, partial [Actinomycetota bacterium]|nr:family 43 glycosylhydrolase [Actinomycetota bacterium]